MAAKKETQDTNQGPTKPVKDVKKTDDIAIPSADVAAWSVISRLPLALMKGTRGMKEAGEEFLPKHTLETVTGYNARLTRSTLLNAFRKTASYLAGQVFQSDAIFAEEVDPDFEAWSESIDTAGNALDVFAKRVFTNGIAKGVSHILVDVPKIDTTKVVTQADEEAAGVRPYFKEIRVEDVLGALVDENGFLIQVRIQETITRKRADSRFQSEVVQRIRVLEPGAWELYELDGKSGQYVLIDNGTFSISTIPFVTFIPGDESSIITGETPLMDLAELNSKHWRSSSDQDNILHVARVPILFGKNIEVAQMPVGTSTMLMSTDTEADVKYVEIQGASIAAGREDLKETEAQMALYGLQQLIPRTGSMTATEKALSSAESNSSLGTWATEYESCLQLAFDIAGQFMKKDFPANSIALNKEYLYGVADANELAQLLKANEQGILSAQATFAEFKRRGIFDEHLSWEDMEADMEQEKRDAIKAAQLAGSAFKTSDQEDQKKTDGTDGTDDEEKDGEGAA